MGNFKVGDLVKVINKGKAYSYYGSFIEKFGKKFTTKWIKGFCPHNLDIGKIVAIGKHEDGYKLAIVEIRENVFIIGFSGIVKIQYPSTIIYCKGRETIAILKDGDKVIKSAKAICNPKDEFNAEYGAKLAFARLYGLDEQVTEILLDGIKVPEFIPTVGRIVKRDKYEVGDKVKIIDQWVNGCRQASYGAMDKWLGKIVTVKKVDSDGDFHIEEDDYWYWNNLCVEGKVVEEPVASDYPICGALRY